MLTNTTDRRPIIDPLLLALRSRRVLVALSALLVALLIMALPDLAAVRDELLTLIATLALALIGGYSVEDAARAARDRAALPPETVREIVREVLNSLVDETQEPGN